jgi:alkanesulfonate monooxygenase SsuD/methylene tetrahydromethanopterin reductase-like flavin-dependent oxidoreductase (luciferase family)
MNALPPRSLGAGNRFKLGIFGANCASGLAATTVPERWQASWQDNAALARLAEKAGIDFLLPIARWQGYRGPSDFHGASLETLSWACGLLGVTQSIAVFGTVHAPMVHPVFAAKQMATIDQIGAGRFGLNIVCGWNPGEFGMFGIDERPHDDRYAYGEEWWGIVRELWFRQDRFDFKGTYFDLKELIGKPRPYGGNRPVVMNAGASAAGRTFAIRNCDLLFTILVDLERSATDLAQIRALGTKPDDVQVLTTCYVVCRPTRREAEEYHHYYAEEHADWEAVDQWYEMQAAHTRSRPPELKDLFRRRFAAGHGCYPLVGSADDVAREVSRIAQAGFAGTTISFVNYLAEFPFFAAEVMPRLEKLGLRAARTSGDRKSEALAL